MALLYAVVVQEVAAGEGPQQRTAAAFKVAGWTYGIDPGLLRAIAEVESSGNPAAVSRKGALGLMQLKLGTAMQFGVRDPFDPVESTVGAARFLSYLRRVGRGDPRIGGHLPQLLAAYNAGEDVVQRYGGIPPYRETRDYVRRVLWLYLIGVVPRSTTSTAHLHAVGADGVRAVSQPPRDGNLAILDQLARLRSERAEAIGARFP